MVFLDNARTTQALELSAKQKAKLKRHLAQYGFANVAAENLRLCRKKIAKLLSCDEDEIFFFPQGCTAAINYVAITLAQNLTSLEKSQIITTQAEHHANYLPWLAYFQEVQILPLDQKSKKIIWRWSN